MSSIILPIIIVDKYGADLTIYTSIEEAEFHLEAIDVKNDEYIGFDAEGHLLKLGVVYVKKRLFFGFFSVRIEHVTITLGEDTNKYIVELHHRLCAYMSSIGISATEQEAGNVKQLIERLLKQQ